MQALISLSIIIIAIALVPSAWAIITGNIWALLGIGFICLIVWNYLSGLSEHQGPAWRYIIFGKKKVEPPTEED